VQQRYSTDGNTVKFTPAARPKPQSREARAINLPKKEGAEVYGKWQEADGGRSGVGESLARSLTEKEAVALCRYLMSLVPFHTVTT